MSDHHSKGWRAGRTWLLGTAIVGLASVGLTACGGASSGGTAAPSGSTTLAAADVSACMAKTAAVVKAAEAPAKLTLPSTPPDLSKIKGKELWFISPSQAFQIILEQSQAFKTAAKAAGLKPVIFNGNSSVQQWNVGVQQATTAHAAAIVLVSIDPKLVSGPLKKAVDAGIPVIDTNNGGGDDPLEFGLKAHVATDVAQGGVWMANYALNKTGCSSGTFGLIYPSIYHSLVEIGDAIHKTIGADCPSCTIIDQDVASNDIATKMGPLAQTMVHSHPDIDMILSPSDSNTQLMVPALQQIGSKVPIVGADATEPNIAYIAKGQIEQASAMWAPTGLLGYELVDEMARLAAGQPAVQEDYPSRLIDSNNIGSGDPDALWSSLGDYAQAFETLWAKG